MRDGLAEFLAVPNTCSVRDSCSSSRFIEKIAVMFVAILALCVSITTLAWALLRIIATMVKCVSATQVLPFENLSGHRLKTDHADLLSEYIGCSRYLHGHLRRRGAGVVNAFDDLVSLIPAIDPRAHPRWRCACSTPPFAMFKTTQNIKARCEG